MQPPMFPKDDDNMSKRSATPDQKGARLCWHCGNGKHLDNECKYAFKGNCSACANLASISEDFAAAQKEYNDLYYDLDSGSEHSTQQDFCEALQVTDHYSQPANSNGNNSDSVSHLKGSSDSYEYQSLNLAIAFNDIVSERNPSANTFHVQKGKSNLQPIPIHTSKPPLNQRT
jgi:hypothetical protein